jgi:hypothetical protein
MGRCHSYPAHQCDNCLVTTLEELVEDMALLLEAPCTLEDAEFRLIGFSDQRGGAAVDTVRQRSILERGSSVEVRDWFHGHGIREAPGPVRTPTDDARGIVGRLCVPARHRGRVYGYFWLLDPDDTINQQLWPEAGRIAEAAAKLLDLVERRQERRDALFRELVEGVTAARLSATELAAAGGLDVHEPVRCVLVQRPELAEQVASRPARPGVVWARAGAGTCAAVVRASLLPATAVLPDVLTALGLSRRVADLDRATHVAVGPAVRGLDELASAHTGALVALRVARAGAGGTVVDWTSLGPLTLLGVARDGDLAWSLIPPHLARFLREATPEVLETARVFLDEAGSASRTAKRLAVHRQTVYHRLSQIERRSGCDLSSGEDRLRLHLALRLAPFVLDPV